MTCQLPPVVCRKLMKFVTDAGRMIVTEAAICALSGRCHLAGKFVPKEIIQQTACLFFAGTSPLLEEKVHWELPWLSQIWWSDAKQSVAIQV